MAFRRISTVAHLRRSVAALMVIGAVSIGSADAQTPGRASALDGATPHIDAVLRNPEVIRGVRAWGLTIADVQHDVDALTPRERARLAYVLTRQWRTNESHSKATLQAQFLVTMSLMRESTLFASVISSGASKLR